MTRDPEQYIGRPSNLSDAELFSLNYVGQIDQKSRLLLYIWTVIIFENIWFMTMIVKSGLIFQQRFKLISVQFSSHICAWDTSKGPPLEESDHN